MSFRTFEVSNWIRTEQKNTPGSVKKRARIRATLYTSKPRSKLMQLWTLDLGCVGAHITGEGGAGGVDEPVADHVGRGAVQLAADVAGELLTAVQAYHVLLQVCGIATPAVGGKIGNIYL